MPRPNPLFPSFARRLAALAALAAAAVFCPATSPAQEFGPPVFGDNYFLHPIQLAASAKPFPST